MKKTTRACIAGFTLLVLVIFGLPFGVFIPGEETPLSYWEAVGLVTVSLFGAMAFIAALMATMNWIYRGK